MDDRDRFSVWLADALLRASDEEFVAESLAAMAKKAENTSLDAARAEADPAKKRPGDIGLEFIGPMLSVVVIEFGRSLWEAYSKELAEKAGAELADATLSKVKDLLRSTWSGRHPAVSLDAIEIKLREAAARAKLDAADTERLVQGLRSTDVAEAVTDG